MRLTRPDKPDRDDFVFKVDGKDGMEDTLEKAQRKFKEAVL